VRRVTVNFPFNSAKISEDYQSDLDRVVQDLQANPNYVALVSGYTDSSGDPDYNIGLAQRRAQGVQLYLAEQLGQDFVRVATIGFGATQPVADNETSDGRARNRRTEVILVRPVPATGSDHTIPTALR
jgi:OOP family OmpA-OmpF porin